MVGSQIAKILREKGIYISDSWLTQCLEYLKTRGVQNSITSLTERVFQLFLMADYHDIFDPSATLTIPENIANLKSFMYPTSLVFQIDEFINVASSHEQKENNSGPKLFKYYLTNGIKKVNLFVSI
jgi:hypothetical protein